MQNISPESCFYFKLWKIKQPFILPIGNGTFEFFPLPSFLPDDIGWHWLDHRGRKKTPVVEGSTVVEALWSMNLSPLRFASLLLNPFKGKSAATGGCRHHSWGMYGCKSMPESPACSAGTSDPIAGHYSTHSLGAKCWGWAQCSCWRIAWRLMGTSRLCWGEVISSVPLTWGWKCASVAGGDSPAYGLSSLWFNHWMIRPELEN